MVGTVFIWKASNINTSHDSRIHALGVHEADLEKNILHCDPDKVDWKMLSISLEFYSWNTENLTAVRLLIGTYHSVRLFLLLEQKRYLSLADLVMMNLQILLVSGQQPDIQPIKEHNPSRVGAPPSKKEGITLHMQCRLRNGS